MLWWSGAGELCFWVPAQLYKQNPTLLHDNDPSSLTREICNWLRFWSQQSQHLQSRHSSRDLRNLSCGGVCKQAGRTSRAQPKKAPAVKPEDTVPSSTFRISCGATWRKTEVVDDTESTIVCRHVHNTENPKSCTMQNMQHAWCFDNTWYMSVSIISKHQIPAWAKGNCQGCQQWHRPSQARFAVNNDLSSWFKHIKSNVWSPGKQWLISWNYFRKSQSLIQLLYLKSNTSLRKVSYKKSTGEFNPKRLIATKWLSNFQIAIQAIQVLWLCPGRHHPNQGHCESTASLPLEPQEKQFDDFPYEQDGTFNLLLQKVDAPHMMTATQSLVGNTVETANSQQYLKARTQHYQSKIDNPADSKSLPTEKSLPCPQVLWQGNVLQQLLHRCYQFRDQSGRRCRT